MAQPPSVGYVSDQKISVPPCQEIIYPSFSKAPRAVLSVVAIVVVVGRYFAYGQIAPPTRR
jgi:hypothetical protein